MLGLTVQHNYTRIIAGSCNRNQTRLQKTLEHLSSGYKINRSADDAAGLTISEKMRSLILGLKQASDNCGEGIRLISVGEGTLTELHSMLQRANILAEQSANGVYQDERDRESLQGELDQLCDEIKRITENANYNGIMLFQNHGYSYETSSETTVTALEQAAQPSVKVSSSGKKVRTSSAAYIMPRAATLDNGVGGDLDIIVSDSGQHLSEVLKNEIVPNVVKNLVTNYSAFSSLQKGSSGIGLRLYNDNNSKTLAFLSNDVSQDLSSYRAYSLNINLNCLRKIAENPQVRADLEAAVTQEITRAFMYEIAPGGMNGITGSSTQNLTALTLSPDVRFPEWFIEGMTLTASGAGEWLNYLGLNESSSVGQIAEVLKNSTARLNSGSPLSKHGTAYLACMYLGAIAGSPLGIATPNTQEEIILKGLNNILGTITTKPTLDSAIYKLSCGRFMSVADFEEKFSTDDSIIEEAASFISGLLKTASNGRGGLSTKDLSATDLAADASSSTSMFRLDTTHSVVRNTTGILKSFTADRAGYGNLLVYGAQQASDVEYDETTRTLTIRGGDDIRLTMKNNTTSALDKVVIEGAARVTLDGVKLTNKQALTIKNDTEIVYSGYNELGSVNLTDNNGVDFIGTGQLRIKDFTTGSTTNHVRFAGGAVLAGKIGNVSSIIIDNAMVHASIFNAFNSEGKKLTNSYLNWEKHVSSTINEITSVELDGKKFDLLLKRGELNYFWREQLGEDDDAKTVNHLTITGRGGVTQHLVTRMETMTITGQPSFQMKAWAPLTSGIDIFQVTGGTKNTDYTIGTDGTLTILTDKQMTISGGIGLTKGNEKKGTLGIPIYGKIKIQDGIGNVNLILDNVKCDQMSDAIAFDLGKNNDVNLTLASGSTNTFHSTGSYNHAGIALGVGTNVTINSAGGVGSTDGILIAQGTTCAAGIGCNGTATTQRGSLNTPTTSCGNITINGGTITATGGKLGGAGIGGANYGSCGTITINGGNITATGQEHGAGIGGGWYDKDHRSYGNGAITITGGHITARCIEHGTGIGAGCMGTSGAITITGDAVIEEALGGHNAAGIGASASGRCVSISILGNATIKNAAGGTGGAGIGAGSTQPNPYGSTVGKIVIDTTGSVSAIGGASGVGIGCGYSADTAGSEADGLSSCGDIQILGGVVEATGGVNSTGIGAGRGSTSGNITIGDANNQNAVVVTATGGMSYNGGNILSYTDGKHTQKGELRIVGDNTTVRAGYLGEGRYSTSGATNQNGIEIFAYPLYLLMSDLLLPAGYGLDDFPLTEDADKSSIQITATGKDGTRFSWSTGLSHAPLEKGYDFIWMTGQEQELVVTYNNANGKQKSYKLNLIFDHPTGIFRAQKQNVLSELANQPDYYSSSTSMPDRISYLPNDTFDATLDPFPNGKPDPVEPIISSSTPDPPKPPNPSRPDPPSPFRPGISRQNRGSRGGIILQVGTSSEETFIIPRFYLSLEALEMKDINIATQKNAWNSIPVIQKAIERVSRVRGSYGAFANRLEHNICSLETTEENVQAAESRIRDVDIAQESVRLLTGSICTQSAQAMLAQCNLNAGWVLQLLR